MDVDQGEIPCRAHSLSQVASFPAQFDSGFGPGRGQFEQRRDQLDRGVVAAQLLDRPAQQIRVDATRRRRGQRAQRPAPRAGSVTPVRELVLRGRAVGGPGQDAPAG
ncbi:hypothetical protein, partial [Nocardia brasiliensis]|uniref:hypothetical protein n=1 Tax=Nocardia brasiliensis TaxID=37326 RepID=UPI002457355F